MTTICTLRFTFITAFQLFSSILSKKLSLVMPAEFTTMEGDVLNFTRISAIKLWTDLPTETSTGRAKCSDDLPPRKNNCLVIVWRIGKEEMYTYIIKMLLRFFCSNRIQVCYDHSGSFSGQNVANSPSNTTSTS